MSEVAHDSSIGPIDRHAVYDSTDRYIANGFLDEQDGERILFIEDGDKPWACRADECVRVHDMLGTHNGGTRVEAYYRLTFAVPLTRSMSPTQAVEFAHQLRDYFKCLK